jgi:hypothetical protein
VVPLVTEALGNRESMRGRMTRKLAWTALYGGLGALAAMGARRAASGIWRRTTGEEPPAKK